MSTEADPQTRTGRLLRWAARRPFALFLTLWLCLTGLFIGAQLWFGVDWEAIGASPPRPEMINYEDYIKGGRRSQDLPISLPADAGPAFNPPPRGHGRPPQVYRRIVDGEARLAVVPVWQTEIGWPRTFARAFGFQAFDVTDPREPFTAFADYFDDVSAYSERGEAILVSDDRSAYWSISQPDTRGLIWWLAGIMGVAALPAIPAALIAWRCNRRWRRGRCILCAHQHPPDGSPSRCQECGFDAPRSMPMPGNRILGVRPCWWFVSGWLTIVAVVCLWTLATPFDEQPQNMQMWYNRFRAIRVDTPNPVSDDICEIGHRFYGWPHAVVRIDETQWFEISPDAGPKPTAAPASYPGFFVRNTRPGEISFMRQHRDDASRVTQVHVRPWLIGCIILLLALVPGVLVAAMMFAAAITRRLRAAEDRPPSGDATAARSG